MSVARKATAADLARPLAQPDPPARWLVAAELGCRNAERNACLLPIAMDSLLARGTCPDNSADAQLLVRHAPSRAIATQSNEHLSVVVPGSDGSFVLEHYLLGSNMAPARVNIGTELPAALSGHGAAVYLGRKGRIDVVDFGASEPSLTVAYTRAGVTKPYDLMARDRDVLVAIDDVVMPIYADTFRISDEGALLHVAAWQLPGVINGSYTLAALEMRSATEGTLYAVTPYSIMSGSGNELLGLPLKDGRGVFPTGLVLQNAAGSGVPVVEEHSPRGGGQPSLLGGTNLTSWSALAVLPELRGDGVLAIAAGERGILLASRKLERGMRATVVPTKMPARDLALFGDALVVLLAEDRPASKEKPASSLVSYKWDGTTLAPVRECALLGGNTRFVH